MLWLSFLACDKPVLPQDSAPDTASWPACSAPVLSPRQSLNVQDFAPTTPEGGGSLGLALEDLDGDGDLDLAVASMEADSLIYTNDGDGNFSITARFERGTGLSTADMDGDGEVDLVLARPFAPNLVIFLDGREPWSFGDSNSEDFSVSVADIDMDGDMDVFAAAYNTSLNPSNLQGGHGTGSHLFENLGDSLVDRSERLPADLLDDVSFMGKWLDADSDGDLDLYTLNDYGPYTGRNRLMLGDGAGNFQEATDCACDKAMYAMGAAVADSNRDGLPELLLSNLAGPLLLSATSAGPFVDITQATGAAIPNTPEHLAGWGNALVDMDGDGLDDLLMVFGTLVPGGTGDEATGLDPEFQDGAEQRDVLLLASEQGYQDASAATGFEDSRVARNLLVGDLDGDGDPDLVSAGLWYIQTWDNSADCAHLLIDLPPNAVGAMVEIQTQIQHGARWFSPASTWSSQPSQIFAGLGHDQLAQVTVTWPDGTQWQASDVPAGRLVVVP